MEKYKIVGKIVLGFIFNNEQQDYLLDSGILERENNTVWFIGSDGKRHESITTANVIEVGLNRGDLEKIKNE